jgi:hypothetical protein
MRWAGNVHTRFRWVHLRGKIPLGRYTPRLEDNITMDLNPLKAELNPICHLLALLGAHHILYVSRIRVKSVGTEWTGLIWLVVGASDGLL